MAQSRALKDGKLKCYWTTTTNNMQAGPNINGERSTPGWRNPEAFFVVSDAYPTVSAMSADLILPCAMWDGEGRRVRQRRAPHQFWRQQGRRRARRSPTCGSTSEFAKRFKVEEVWPEELIAKKPSTRQDAVRRALANGVEQVPAGRRLREGQRHGFRATRTTNQGAGFYLQKGLFEEYAAVRPRPRPRPRAFDVNHEVRGLRWPVVDGKETLWRFRGAMTRT